MTPATTAAAITDPARTSADYPQCCRENAGLSNARAKPIASEELAASMAPLMTHCIEQFGPDRCMFESNFPPDKQSGGYTELWNAFKRITAGASVAEKTALYSGTAARVYRLTVPG